MARFHGHLLNTTVEHHNGVQTSPPTQCLCLPEGPSLVPWPQKRREQLSPGNVLPLLQQVLWHVVPDLFCFGISVWGCVLLLPQPHSAPWGYKCCETASSPILPGDQQPLLSLLLGRHSIFSSQCCLPSAWTHEEERKPWELCSGTGACPKMCPGQPEHNSCCQHTTHPPAGHHPPGSTSPGGTLTPEKPPSLWFILQNNPITNLKACCLSSVLLVGSAAMAVIDLPPWYPWVPPGHHSQWLFADRMPGSKGDGREQLCLAGREWITNPSFCQEPFLCCNSYFSTASLQKALGEMRAMTPEITNQSLLESLFIW